MFASFVYNDTWFALLLVLHVSGAIIGLGSNPSFDPNKSWGKGQQAPLTAKYEAVLETNLKAQKDGSFFCAEGNGHIFIGKENYFISADG